MKSVRSNLLNDFVAMILKLEKVNKNMYMSRYSGSCRVYIIAQSFNIIPLQTLGKFNKGNSLDQIDHIISLVRNIYT